MYIKNALFFTFMNANKDNPAYQLMGVRTPTMNPGEKAMYVTEYEFGGNPQLGITTACKNVEAAMRLYDFGFSEEGYRRFNWGEEGVSYTMENGKPQYTELILKNPEGKSVDTVLANYAMTAIRGPAMLVQDPDYSSSITACPSSRQWRYGRIRTMKTARSQPYPTPRRNPRNLPPLWQTWKPMWSRCL